MVSVPMRAAALSAAFLATAALAACGSSSSSGSAAAPPSKPTGTLNIVAASGPDHLDPVPAYYTADYMLERAYARQMLAYPYGYPTTIGDSQWQKTVTPVPDAATQVPTTSNGGITNGGKTYTFTIRPGVTWQNGSAVTSADFLREFKAFCNPAPGGFVGNIGYFESTIAGLTSYCNAETSYFANTKTHPITAANVTKFQNTHSISGINAPKATVLKITLIHPAADFNYMMAMPFTSARPSSYDNYLPNSAQLNQHIVSDGPYKITSYSPGKSLTMATNTNWKQSSDPIRHQYVAKIVLTMGVSDAATQLADEQAGKQDLVLDTPFEPSAIPGMLSSHNPQFKIWPWSNTFPYIVFNLKSPDAGGAMAKLGVRQAFQYGLNKVAVQKVYGGPDVATILNSVIPPGNTGYLNTNFYPNNSGNGDVSKCKSTLSSAGYPHGLTLTALYINDSVNSKLFSAVQASLAQCGIKLNGKPEPGSSYFVDLGNAPSNKPGQWDVGFPGWIPDWFGLNGRTIIPPFFQTDCRPNTINYGCVDNAQMNSLINQAETTTSTSTAGSLWGQANTLAMHNAWIVPMVSQQAPYFSSTRTHNSGSTAIAYQPNIGGPDITNVWVTG
jgi:peptide/nickel transport system substrate-binding protein